VDTVVTIYTKFMFIDKALFPSMSITPYFRVKSFFTKLQYGEQGGQRQTLQMWRAIFRHVLIVSRKPHQ